MLGRDQLRRWVDHFGTPESQVRRDHLISHLLARLPDIAPTATFFGGTALCRTHLRDWRLSEDIDLLVDSMEQATSAFDDRLTRSLRREYPELALQWDRDGDTRVGLVAVGDLVVRIQLVAFDSSYRLYPNAHASVDLRYEDLPVAFEFNCPTRDGATAMKLNAWSDRAAPRDLCDLYGLVTVGALTQEAVGIAAAASRSLQRHDFDPSRLPSESSWQVALAHQMRQPPPRERAFFTVRSALADIVGWDHDQPGSR